MEPQLVHFRPCASWRPLRQIRTVGPGPSGPGPHRWLPQPVRLIRGLRPNRRLEPYQELEQLTHLPGKLVRPPIRAITIITNLKERSPNTSRHRSNLSNKRLVSISSSTYQASSEKKLFLNNINPSPLQIKKASEMSVLAAKNSPEFRRPPTVQRNNKGGLAKYLGAVTANGRSNHLNGWDMRDLTISPPPFKKSPLVLLPRSVVKLEKKLSKPIPGLPVPDDVLSTLPNCTISSLRLTSDESSDSGKGSSTHSVSPTSLEDEPLTIGFKDNIIGKPMHVNENNNLTNNSVSCASALLNSRSQGDHPFLRLSIPADSEKKEVQIAHEDEDDEEEEDSSRDGVESKPPLSPILSAPTTIRFPAQTPDKDRSQSGDSGFCRWDKCEAGFESSGGLLEHLQVRS